MIAFDDRNWPLTVQFNRWLTTKVPCGLMQWRPPHAEVSFPHLSLSLFPSSHRCSTDHVFVFIVIPQPQPRTAGTRRPNRSIIASRNDRKLARLVSPSSTNVRAITTIPDQHNICIVEIHPAITTHPPRAPCCPFAGRTACGRWLVDQHALDPVSFQVLQSDSATEWAGKNAEKRFALNSVDRTRFNLGPQQRGRSIGRWEQKRVGAQQ